MSDKIQFLDQIMFSKVTDDSTYRTFFDINTDGELEISGVTTVSTSGVKLKNHLTVNESTVLNGPLTVEASGSFTVLNSGLVVTGPNPQSPYNPPGTGTYTPNTVINGTLRVTGDIITQGTIGAVERDDLRVTDNKILLNVGETGPGITLGQAGIVVIRDSNTGSIPHAGIVLDDSDTANPLWDFNFGIPQDVDSVSPIGASIPLPNNPRLINVSDPIDAQDVSTKNFVNTEIQSLQDSIVLTNLNDVTITPPEALGQILRYKNGLWVNDVFDIEELHNVNAPLSNGFFRWNNGAVTVEYQSTIDSKSGDITNLSTVATIDNATLGNLEDVITTGATDKQLLISTHLNSVWKPGHSDKITNAPVNTPDTYTAQVSVSDIQDSVLLSAGTISLSLNGPSSYISIDSTDDIPIVANRNLTISSAMELILDSSADLSIQGITYPATDGTARQVLATNGSSSVDFITLDTTDISDFTIAAGQDEDVLAYNGTTEQWENKVNSKIRDAANTSYVDISLDTVNVVANDGPIVLDAGEEDVIITGGTTGTPAIQSDESLKLEAATLLQLTAGTDISIQGYTFPRGTAQRSSNDVLRVDGSSNLSYVTLGLNYMSDVSIPTPVDNEVLTYSGGKWLSLPLPADTSPTTLAALDDTAVTPVPSGYLRWNSLGNSVVYETEIPLSSLETGNTIGDVLTWNGATWESSQLPPTPKPILTTHIGVTGAGPFALTGEGGTNASGTEVSTQLFINGLLAIEGVDYTVAVGSGAPGSITVTNIPVDPYTIAVYEY